MSTSMSQPGIGPGDPAVPAEPAVPLGERERAGRLKRAQWLVGLGGLAAGLVAFGIGEATYNCIPPERVLQNTMGTMAMAITSATQAKAEVRNAALAFAILGGCLAGAMGMAGGLARRSVVVAAGAGLLGLCLGAGVAAGISLATLPWFAEARITHSDYEMAFSFLMHCGIWGLSGAVAGLAFAIGRWSDDRRLFALAPVGGFIGAVIGAMAFEVAGAGLFPLAYTGDPVSTDWPSRLTARLLVALATAAGVILFLPGATHSPSISQPPIPATIEPQRAPD
jgi:hypothetical protein